jgi:hypothetical protein
VPSYSLPEPMLARSGRLRMSGDYSLRGRWLARREQVVQVRIARDLVPAAAR